MDKISVFSKYSDEPYVWEPQEVDWDLHFMHGFDIFELFAMKYRFTSNNIDRDFYKTVDLRRFSKLPIHEQVKMHKKYRIKSIGKDEFTNKES